ncbi:hypothetical protein [Streptomyces radicis]|uniref:SAF domain-containing protein n=1 Tax=Streptomyces radicis TaxID=1750517 RepID=A0A3A9WNY1_9ACTN|nr:hypothetical protein [Streptomyces radicis]RKN07887.1 hypothetical protein D7319_17650 [Streptomyces radicis]RKN20659.1 hypothetical protein D7318_17270 [Streptomyces radicis]
MRTQDRASAARTSMAAGAVPGERLPTPPRERRPALAALAALLVLAGALGATVLVLRAGDRVEAVRITERVPAGERIPESAMESVLVAEDSAVNYVPWGQRSQVADDLRSVTDLVPGTVLVGEMLTGEASLPQDEVLVGVSLQPGQYPSGLAAGDTVAAYWVGDDDAPGSGDETSESAPPPISDDVIADPATVAAVHDGDGGGGNSALPVTLRVGADDAAALTRAASNGEVSLVIVAPPGE